MLATNRANPLNILRWALAPLATVLLVVLLLQPEQQPIINTGIPPGPPSLARDLFFIIGHILWFTLLVVLWRWMLTTRFHASSALVLAVLIALIIGTSTEYAQRFVPGRGATLVDLLANYLGIVFAALMVRYHTLLKDASPNRPYNPLGSQNSSGSSFRR